ncbi:MAG: hypothetical protein PWQ91_558 [Eubacteriales bacterium]|nr:hypothetical protein [Eubacteriales bacterium]
MWLLQDKYVLGMSLLRFLSATIEFTAAVLMWKSASVEKAFKINAVLAAVGPFILTAVTAIGLAGLAGKVAPARLVLILAGVALIFAGLSR